MFTGLIDKLGTLEDRQLTPSGGRLRIAHPGWLDPLVNGESIAVQGVCLTVVDHDDATFQCDVLNETLARTGLGSHPIGAVLNLERALKLGDRLGGHILSGHVDGQGQLAAIEPVGRDRKLIVSCSPELTEGIVHKGSIALDGVSLTITEVSPTHFAVHLIPVTWERTSLRERTIGDALNIEVDMIGKYVRRYVQDAAPTPPTITIEVLKDAGFLDA